MGPQSEKEQRYLESYPSCINHLIHTSCRRMKRKEASFVHSLGAGFLENLPDKQWAGAAFGSDKEALEQYSIPNHLRRDYLLNERDACSINAISLTSCNIQGFKLCSHSDCERRSQNSVKGSVKRLLKHSEAFSVLGCVAGWLERSGLSWLGLGRDSSLVDHHRSKGRQ